MKLIIPNVLTEEEVRALRQGLQQGKWEPGQLTAGAGSRSRKNNLQIAPTEPALNQWRDIVSQALYRNPMVQFLVLPKVIMPPVFNRYDTGMYYRDHVDFPLLGGSPKMRADLSLTLFITPPEGYLGGELVVGTDSQESTFKLPCGHAIVYPASTIHRVETVRDGSRVAAVTTVQSHIRDESKRQLLADYVRLWRWVEDMAPNSENQRLAAKIHHNLVRLWAD